MITTEDAPTIFAVGGVVYRRTLHGSLEVLLIKKRLGFWTLPKGRVKCDEADEDAVAREVREETGLRGPVGAAVRQVSYIIYKHNQPRRKVVTYYLLHAKKGRLRPSSKEQIQRVRWFPLRAALRRIRRARVRAIVQQAALVLAQDVAQVS